MKHHLFNPIISWALKKRIHQINTFINSPIKSQNELLLNIIQKSQNTFWGKKYNYKNIKSYTEFKKNVPIHTYEEISLYIKMMRNGLKNILWPGKIYSFAKSSGTTNEKSKFIPITRDSLRNCHLKAGKDLLSIYLNQCPKSEIFKGKSLMIGGSNEIDKTKQILTGDLSSILIENLPFWTQLISTPKKNTALIANWEKKIDKIISEVIFEDVRSISGVPSWTILLLKKILHKTKKTNIKEIWPNLELYMHGGISISPYIKSFNKLIGKKINYLEIYNASEGFFAIQNDLNQPDLLLMLDYGIFYEFIPMINGQESNQIVSLKDVKKNINYAMIISTNAGLWRYNIGDTIKFTSINPYKILVTGRTKHFINCFGEEVMIHNTDLAIKKASEKTNNTINDYTVAPLFFEDKSGCHEWIIEFDSKPKKIKKFSEILDQTLKNLNSDYEAKRQKNLLLKAPIIHIAKKKFFYNFLKKNKKLGGQNKIPRLSNNRKKIHELIQFL